MKCPLCGKKLVTRNGQYGKFLGCSGYPSCNFKLNLSSLKVGDVEDRLEYRKKEREFLEEKHSPKNCDKCNGEKSADDFFNSLYHDLFRRGYLTNKQQECIEQRVKTFNISDERTDFKYPLRQSLNGQQLEELDKHGL